MDKRDLEALELAKMGRVEYLNISLANPSEEDLRLRANTMMMLDKEIMLVVFEDKERGKIYYVPKESEEGIDFLERFIALCKGV